MRAAMYYPWIYVKGGIERTILEIVKRSRHDWTVFTSHYRPEDTFPEFADIEVKQLGSVSVKRDVLSVARACAELLLRSSEWSGYDALMVSCDGIGNLVALRPGRTPVLCLCHTPLKISYDPYARERWMRLFQPSLLSRVGVGTFRLVDRLAWRRYRRVFCVSREVERRLEAAGVVRPGRTEVVHPGIDTVRMVPSGRKEPFFLIPGRIMWSKNIELGLRAFIEMKAGSKRPEVRMSRLVVAGMVDEKSQLYLRQLRDLVAGRNDVEFVLSPTDDELLDLYDRCYAVLFTPPNEDWGIVPLEAMAFGKPVVAVGRGGPAESIVDGETGYLRGDSPSSFAGAMSVLLGLPEVYERMSTAARQRALRYDWTSFVGRIDEYLGELVAEPVAKELSVRDAHRV